MAFIALVAQDAVPIKAPVNDPVNEALTDVTLIAAGKKALPKVPALILDAFW